MQYSKKILKSLDIDIRENVEENEINLQKSLQYTKEGVLFLNDNSLIIKNPYENKIYSIKSKEKIEKTYLINENIFQKLKEKVLNSEESSITVENEEEELNYNELDDTEVSQLIKNVIFAAMTKNVSDIHILPKEKNCEIKFRDNGDLILYKKVPKAYSQIIVNKLKSLANMDITKSLEPQDGKASMDINGKSAECRISTLPTIWGENAVMRVQQADNLFDITLDDIGFYPEDLAIYRNSFKKPTGLILNVGATGSGKTTTFYLTIAELIDFYKGKKNIVTAEDPVEIKFDKITQIEVDERQNRSFAKVLKALMRQDPDIILIGEIRDEETAGIAAKAALTGHSVLATLHANDSITAITRLRDVGVSNVLIAAIGNAFLSQKLLKKLCPICKKERRITPKESEKFGFKENGITYEKVGCNSCNNSGYKGRLAVSEVLEIDSVIKGAISKGLSEVEIKQAAKEKGFKNLWINGVRRMEEGIISLEDLVSTITRDIIINPIASDTTDIEMVTMEKKEIYFPIEEVIVKTPHKKGLLYEITEKKLSIVFNEKNYMTIHKEIILIIEDKKIDFVPLRYGSVRGKFIVEGNYIGNLGHYLDIV